MLVKVSRLSTKKPGDIPFDLTVVGHLSDKDGNLISAPITGEPIYLTDGPGKPWKFQSRSITSLVAFEDHWTVWTDGGPYMIFRVNLAGAQ